MTQPCPVRVPRDLAPQGDNAAVYQAGRPEPSVGTLAAVRRFAREAGIEATIIPFIGSSPDSLPAGINP